MRKLPDNDVEGQRHAVRTGQLRTAAIGATVLTALGAGGLGMASAQPAPAAPAGLSAQSAQSAQSAPAGTPAVPPANHVFLSYHGMPTYTWTLRLYDYQDHEVFNTHQTCVGGCKHSFPWDPVKVRYAYFKINSGSHTDSWNFVSSTDSGHDHCILVKAGGKLDYTGTELQGCNGK